MPLRFGRASVVTIAILAFIVSAAAGAGGRGSVKSASPTVAGSQYNQVGISAALAAKALNSELARQSKHAARRNMTSVNFILNWLPNVEFSGLWVAAHNGWWQKAGIDMHFEPWSQSVHPETDVPEHGGNTFGFQAGAAIAIAQSKGVQIKALYSDTQHSVFGLTVLNTSHINKITDLRGKKIGYQPHELYVPQTMLAYAGLKQSDWVPIPVGFDIVQLTARRVDAYETFLTNEPISLQLQGVKTHSFAAGDYGYHSYDDVLFTYNGLINKNPTLVRKVVRIVAQGFNWAHRLPDQAAKITLRTYFAAAGAGETAKTHRLQQIIESRDFRSFSRDASGRYRGLMTASVWRDNINTLFKYHLISSKPNLNSVFTNRFNPYR